MFLMQKKNTDIRLHFRRRRNKPESGAGVAELNEDVKDT
jgi:hypothetical protein